MNASEAQRWMDYARSDLDAANLLLERGEFFPRQICFMSQQAGEKALKAILVYLEIHFPKIRDLDRLRLLRGCRTGDADRREHRDRQQFR